LTGQKNQKPLAAIIIPPILCTTSQMATRVAFSDPTRVAGRALSSHRVLPAFTNPEWDWWNRLLDDSRVRRILHRKYINHLCNPRFPGLLQKGYKLNGVGLSFRGYQSGSVYKMTPFPLNFFIEYLDLHPKCSKSSSSFQSLNACMIQFSRTITSSRE
jgi:hypothetical protein